MASLKLLRERLDDIENVCCELQERINIKDLWADNKIYAIAAVAHNTLDEVIRQKKRITLIIKEIKYLKQEVKELRNEIEELGADRSMRHNDNI